jgi:hypothetical protein
MKLAALLACLIASSVYAQVDSPLTITESGYFLTEIGDDGVPVYVKIPVVVDLTEASQERPEAPEIDKELVDRIKVLATKIDDPASAQAIAAVYAHIRGAVADGTLSSETMWGPLKGATDSALALIGGKDWTEWRDGVTAIFTLAKQRGQLNDAKQIDRMLMSIQAGVELAADGSTAISMDKTIEIARRTNTAIDGVKQ